MEVWWICDGFLYKAVWDLPLHFLFLKFHVFSIDFKCLDRGVLFCLRQKKPTGPAVYAEVRFSKVCRSTTGTGGKWKRMVSWTSKCKAFLNTKDHKFELYPTWNWNHIRIIGWLCSFVWEHANVPSGCFKYLHPSCNLDRDHLKKYLSQRHLSGSLYV